MNRLKLTCGTGIAAFINEEGNCWILNDGYFNRKPLTAKIGKTIESVRRFLRKNNGMPTYKGRPVKKKCDNDHCISPTCSAYADDPVLVSKRIMKKLQGTEPTVPLGCLKLPVSRSSPYPMVKVNGDMKKVSRLLLEASGVKLWSDDEASHLCEQKDCCEPNHLMPASQSMNQRFTILQSKPETKLSLDEAREWHRREYRKYRPDWLIPGW